MKEGLLSERKGKIFPYDAFISALYGFNNYYGVTARVARGGTDPTMVGEDPKNDIIELNVVGLSVKPEDLRSIYDNFIPYLYDKISDDDRKAVMEKIACERQESDMTGVDPMKKYNVEKRVFECLNRQEVVKILRDIRDMPLRTSINKPPIKIEGIIHVDKRVLYYPEKYK